VLTLIAVTNGKVAWWTAMLLELNLHYISQKSIKRRAMFDFLADLPTEDKKKETF